MEPLAIVSVVFVVVALAGIVLIAYLWNGYKDLQVENERLQAQINTLLSLLDHYLTAEKQVAQTPARRDILDEVLAEVRLMRQGINLNVTQIGERAQVGQVASGKGNAQES